MKTTNEIILQSLGAAETVTGSKHLLRTPELNILVDCGLFQGIKSLRMKNREELPVHPGDIDVLLLTHAHLDHCGYIPLFVKKGFRGKIYMTPPTKDLTEIILYDSAKIQEEDAEKANQEGYSKHKPALPLYKTEDVDFAISHFETVEHSSAIQLSPHISFQFRKNGHILGSACVQLNCFDKTIVFSGDIGRYQSDFLLAPANMSKTDYVIMESTYGDRLHKGDPAEQLAAVINEAVDHHGTILIPSFAVGRAQEIMHILNKLKKENRIPHWLPVFLDSPMAADATEILCNYPKWHKLKHDECMSVCKDVVINRDWHNTKDIIHKHGSKIVISASGMLTGGRVLEYMKHLTPHENNIILLIGYQAEGTRGRALQNKAHEVKIHGKYYPVKARVVEISGLSAHADQSELIEWLKSFQQLPLKIFLVHGEPSAQEVLRVKIQDELKIPAHIQQQNQAITLFNTNVYANATSL
ncbi:MAG: MBL fold metallo-hydrolase [Sediminibacterium magnilacihabitans]|jgi:metallo-beta-lactamase family protein|nr:MBL fold metallo-hydrolase [Sediminibacterium magnilacihabitans]PQV61839.1 metallo-beta-lactamase family protein [Sediminibacterium magnilacihabitans]